VVNQPQATAVPSPGEPENGSPRPGNITTQQTNNNIMKIKSHILLPAFALMASAVVATAQDRPSPEEFRARMEERLKTSLKVSDDEWKVLQPLIEKVGEKQRAGFGGFGGFGGGRGRGGDGGGASAGGTAGSAGGGGDRQGRGSRGGSEESQALRTALESESTSPEDIKAKLAAVRDHRKKAAAELAAARAELLKVVTVRQEAVLVSMGMLE
jgi:hypothetical protein